MNHIRGEGCLNCYNLKRKKQSKGLERFVRDANVIHDNLYDYSKVEYINNKTKIKIICKEHGVFKQRPDSHLGQKQQKTN